MMSERYQKNMNMISENEIELLHRKKVCVVGCGGLGGYVSEMLGRLGIESLILVDGDVFDPTNLNRQLLSSEDVVGESKVEIAKKRLSKVNPNIGCQIYNERLAIDNAATIIDDADLVVDAVDNIVTKRLLQTVCKEKNIPLVHGAIAGWYAQVTTIFPGDDTLDQLYELDTPGIELELGNPSFTPALAASLQVAEVLKVLLNKGEILRRRVFLVDTLKMETTILPMK